MNVEVVVAPGCVLAGIVVIEVKVVVYVKLLAA